MTRLFGSLLIALLLAGCQDQRADETAQEAPAGDTAVLRSNVPRAGAINRALEASDAAARRNATLDSLRR